MAADKFRIQGDLEFNANDVRVKTGSVDPSAGAGVAAVTGTIYLRNISGTSNETWHKTGAADTAWTKLIDTAYVNPEDGYQNTFMGKSGLGSETPSYSSQVHITDGDSLETAAGKLDAALNTHETDTSNPHDVTLEQARAQGNQLAGDIDMNNAGTIINLPNPTNDQDAANKRWVESLIQGIKWKEPVRAATTAALVDAYTYDNGTLGEGATMTKDTNGAFPAQDGITLVQGDRVLIKNQTAGAAPHNGIYELTTVGDAGTPWVLTRTTDMDLASEFVNAATFVEEGTDNADTGYVMTSDAPITVGTTAITWVEFTRLGQIIAGAGLTKTGDTLNVGDANKGVQVNADDLQVDASEIAGDGLEQLAGGGNEHIIKAKAGDSGAANLANVVSVESNGLSVKVDETSIQENASNQLETIGYHNKLSGTNVAASGGVTLDSVPIATYWSAKWLVTIRNNTNPDRMYACEVFATQDGTTVDFSEYAINRHLPAIPSVSIDVDIDSGNMRLRVTTTPNIDYRVTRIVH